MKVLLPFTYLQARPETGEIALRIAGFDFDISDMGESEAPAALSWQELWSDGPLEGYMAVDRACRYRDGRFFAAVGDTSDGHPCRKTLGGRALVSPLSLTAFGDLSNVLTTGSLGDSTLFHSLPYDRARAVADRVGDCRIGDRELSRRKARSDGLDRRVLEHGDTRDFDLAAARRQASRLAVIGGEVWREVPEPRLEIDDGRGGCQVRVAFGESRTKDIATRFVGSPQKMSFGFDRFEEMLEAAARAGIRLSYPFRQTCTNLIMYRHVQAYC